MPVPFIPIAAMALQATGTAANILSNNSTNQKNLDFQREMYNTQRQDALDDWNRQNAYNDPSAQMARLRTAGINPNLAFGSANTVSQPVRSSSAPAGNARPNDYSGFADAIMQFQDLTMRQAQIDNTRAQGEILAKERVLQDLKEARGIFDLDWLKDTRTVRQDSLNLDHDYKVGRADMMTDLVQRARALEEPTLQAAIQKVALLKAQTANTEEERNRIKQMVDSLTKGNELKQLEINLAEKGISKSDPVYLRVLTQLLEKIFPSWFGSIGK